MSVSTPGIFGHSAFSGGATRKTDNKAAAAGFAQVFTTMLAKQMHQSMVGEDSGPMGTEGGSSGDIYGSLLDQALGKTLANSKSMKSLTAMISKGLRAPRHPIASAFKDSLVKTDQTTTSRISPISGQATSGTETVMARLSQIGTSATLGIDARGPVLLPPAPTEMAPQLLPPPPLEG
jgi:Rod binding domain-containing protein